MIFFFDFRFRILNSNQSFSLETISLEILQNVTIFLTYIRIYMYVFVVVLFFNNSRRFILLIYLNVKQSLKIV